MTEPEPRYEYEDEINLMEYLNVIWKRKWLILIPTFFLVLLAGVYSFLQTPVWEVESLIQPAKFTIQTEGGQFQEVLVTPPKQIAGQINEKSYNQLIAAELNLDIRRFPETQAQTLNDTPLIRITTKDSDTQRAESIQLTLFKHLKAELDKKADVEMKNIDTKIKSRQIEKDKIKEEIDSLNNKLKIIKNRKNNLEKSITDTQKRIELLEKEQRNNLKKENLNSAEALGMLLYSNEIQQSLQYLDTLNESLSRKRIEEENLKIKIEEHQQSIEQINNTIENLIQKKDRIDFTQMMKEPTSSLGPVAPKKKLNVAIAGFLGLFLFTILAFFIEYIQKNKQNTD